MLNFATIISRGEHYYRGPFRMCVCLELFQNIDTGHVR
jgi:hypothetical protein